MLLQPDNPVIAALREDIRAEAGRINHLLAQQEQVANDMETAFVGIDEALRTVMASTATALRALQGQLQGLDVRLAILEGNLVLPGEDTHDTSESISGTSDTSQSGSTEGK